MNNIASIVMNSRRSVFLTILCLLLSIANAHAESYSCRFYIAFGVGSSEITAEIDSRIIEATISARERNAVFIYVISAASLSDLRSGPLPVLADRVMNVKDRISRRSDRQVLTRIVITEKSASEINGVEIDSCGSE